MDPEDVPPRDRRKLVLIAMILQGVGALIVWISLVNCKSYFVEYILAGTGYQKQFLNSFGYSSSVPSVISAWLNVFYRFGSQSRTRILVAISVEVFLVLIMIILAMVDNVPPAKYFYTVMVILVIISGRTTSAGSTSFTIMIQPYHIWSSPKLAFNGVYRNSIYGEAAVLSPKYIVAVVLGHFIGGVTILSLGLLFTMIGAHLKTVAIYSMIIAMTILMACFDSLVALPLNIFYRYFRKHQLHVKNVKAADYTIGPKPRNEFMDLLSQCWVQHINIFLSSFVSYTLFPAVYSEIYSMSNPTLEFGKGLFGKNFLNVAMLLYSACCIVGCLTAMRWQYPTRRYMLVFTLLRIIFIPIFVNCNYHPKGVKRTKPVWINNDAAYLFLGCILGWSFSHTMSLSMMYACSNLPDEYVQKAGHVAGAVLMTTIVIGTFFSSLAPYFV